MSSNIINSGAHARGTTRLAFSKDGSRVYTGGEDCLVRIWDVDGGAEKEPSTAADSEEAVTWIATAEDCWLSSCKDSDVRRYAIGSTSSDATVTSTSVPARSIAIDPKGRKVAVASDELKVRVVDLEDTVSVQDLTGYTAHARAVSWHPSGNILTTCTADGKILIWDLSEDEPRLEKTIEGILPVVKDDESTEYGYDCSAVWHPSGSHFYVASKSHQIVAISRSDWSKIPGSFSHTDALGAITALAISPNGEYLASASQSTVRVWSTKSRQHITNATGTPGATITQLAFCPKRNLIAWTDDEGGFSRWSNPIDKKYPDPVRTGSAVPTTTTSSTSKKSLENDIFADDDKMDEDDLGGDDVDLDDDIDLHKNFIEDDMDGALNDDDEPAGRRGGSGYVKEMVSITKAQPPFQPGSTPFVNKKRYLAFNMLGVIEATDQDVHQIINVSFFNTTERPSFHFTDNYKNDMGYLGECGAVFACPPEAGHPAQVLFKPYSPTAKEWRYSLRPGTSVLGIAAGGLAPKEGLRNSTNADLQGYGNVVVATSENDLTFLSGTGRERRIMALGGDLVTMVASAEWVFVVHRPGFTTIDGSQNLYYTVINFDDFSVRQRDVLPVPKNHTLKWVGLTEQGLPAMYDSTGYLHILTKVRIPHHAAWVRIMDTNLLERRKGKDESYWPVGVSDENFMCIILKGRQEHPGFPRPLMQELPIQLPFRQAHAGEERIERNLLYVQTALDSLDDDLTTEDIQSREQAIDKEFIILIQHACKDGNTARALELVKLLHNIPSFDAAIAIANFYSLQGLKEKMEYLKQEREEDEDRLIVLRNKRRRWMKPDAPLRQLAESSSSRYDPLGDVRAPPPVERPGMARVTKPVIETTRFSSKAPSTQSQNFMRQSSPAMEASSSSQWADDQTMRDSPPPVEKRKRDEVEDSFSSSTMGPPPPKNKFNPFARKAAPDTNKNPFARNSENNKSLHKSESFFDKVDAAEAGSISTRKRPVAKGKDAKKDAGPKQATLFNMLPKKDKTATAKKPNGTAPNGDVDMTDESQQTVDDNWEETQLADEET
ncbi:hypothetical protein CC1G_03326 [Coprinopsis cinerea okayama7|uniref:Uncharacterized protein n=1 Tax=Coprinopsis cinerea (strain Okayama-7 / 130 / ATCC MYA-4618 / FGSC 9003) TaxID=240176 RepID=A8N7I3_COPC7|nr:hypothetical protein CC1G_03326 [Coprinopsis cinerea okayama7\|eukprot:XP_001830789.2 hypothetical protein CC1G_03326 [Coprinopsis cinerea okayama7\